MNFSLPSTPAAPAPPPQARDLPDLQRPGSRRRPGRGRGVVLAGGALVLAATGVLAVGLPGSRSRLRPLRSLFAASAPDVVTYEVRAADLPVVVTERGSLESSQNEDVYCQVEGQTTIISILPEGTRVKKGQVVCELDSAALKDQLTSQMITTKGAEAALQQARLTREVAEIAVTEYVEGIYKADKETALGEIALADSDRRRAEDRLVWSENMLKKKYISPGQKLSDKLALDRAIFSYEQAQTKLKVLEKYTKDKTVKELKSEVEKARADELAKQSTWELEKTKEDKLRRLIGHCVIKAPDDGLIVYANDPGRGMGQQTPQIEEGATVRERQKIFSLPDISKMQVNTKIHESMIDRITPGLRSRIRVDAFAESTLNGTVKDVAPLPDPSTFFSSDIKVYTSHVTIDNPLSGLRPGMTAQVEILVTRLSDVLSVPVTAVLQFKGKDHVAVKTPTGYAFRDVKLGISNDKLVEVKEGIKSGDKVALNPIGLMSEEEQREAFGSADKDAAKKEWEGDAAKAAPKVGQAPVPPGVDPAKAADKAKAKAKGKGQRGAGMPPALRAKMQNLAPEDRRSLFGGSPEEREAALKKAGFTEDEVKQLDQIRQNFGGGRGPGGGGGFGGPGGGRGGFGGGAGGPQP